MPAVVALVASNFGQADRPRAYGLVASAGAIAVAAGPLIGGLFTTYASWRWVSVGEVLVVLIILALARRMGDTPAEKGARLDIVGTVLSALGLALVVFGVLSSGTWGLIIAKPEAPEWLGLSPVIWLILVGGWVLSGFLGWERRRLGRGQGVLVDPAILDNKLLRGGLVSFFQYLLQAGLFFVVPLFLSVALGLSAIATGVQLLPLSITLLLAAVGVPKVFPNASPRRVVRIGFLALFASTVILIVLLDLGAGPEIITWPMLLAGLGVGALASQLGAVTVSAVPDEQSGEVGGLQNTVTNLGASIGTALAGAVLITALSASFFTGIQGNPAIPEEVSSNAQVELASGIPFISDTDLRAALEAAGVPAATADAIVEENQESRLAGYELRLLSWRYAPYWRSASPTEYQPVSRARPHRATSRPERGTTPAARGGGSGRQSRRCCLLVRWLCGRPRLLSDCGRVGVAGRRGSRGKRDSRPACPRGGRRPPVPPPGRRARRPRWLD
jgi:MFS family permease